LAEPVAVIASEPRVILLQGGCNFRDLGGYAAAEGRTVRSGVLFRSGVLAYLTQSDLQSVTQLSIKSICDLRRSDEIVNEPTRWPTKVQTFSWLEDPELGRIQRAAGWERAKNGHDAAETMRQAYRGMVEWLLVPLRGIFGVVLAGDIPLLFHCAAGKDRTGFCSAILLHALGVPRDVILKDFAFTNEAADLYGFTLRHRKAGLGLVSDQQHPMENMEPEVRRALLSADVSYLTAAFEQIERVFGSADLYLREAVGLSDLEIARMRSSLLM
jgi:protein-tyrosine phosphatase